MERYTHLTLNGSTKTTLKDTSLMDSWMSNLIEEINKRIREIYIEPVVDPISSYVDKDGVKGITTVAIVESGYIALRIWEKEDDTSSIHLDILLSSPLPVLTVIDSLVYGLGMYDGIYMLLDRKDDFKTIEYKSYP
jgi:hypothetical protein